MDSGDEDRRLEGLDFDAALEPLRAGVLLRLALLADRFEDPILFVFREPRALNCLRFDRLLRLGDMLPRLFMLPPPFLRAETLLDVEAPRLLVRLAIFVADFLLREADLILIEDLGINE